MVILNAISDVSTVGDCNLNNKVTEGHYVLKLTVYTIFPKAFHQWLSDLDIIMETFDEISDGSTFGITVT